MNARNKTNLSNKQRIDYIATRFAKSQTDMTDIGMNLLRFNHQHLLKLNLPEVYQDGFLLFEAERRKQATK